METIETVRAVIAGRQSRLQRLGAKPKPVVQIPIVEIEEPSEIEVHIVDPEILIDWTQMLPQVEQEPRPLRIQDIQRAVCQFYRMSMTELLSARRTKEVARKRQVAMYLCKTLTGKSYPEIGRRFGGRDHSTIIHGTHLIDGLLAKHDAEIAAQIAGIKALL